MSDRLKQETPAKLVVIEVGLWEIVSRSGPCKFNALDVRIALGLYGWAVANILAATYLIRKAGYSKDMAAPHPSGRRGQEDE